MQNRKFLSTIPLVLSLIIFSAVIPLTQSKINELKEHRETYFKNLLNAELQRIISVLSVDFYGVIDSLKKSESITNENLIKSLDEIQKNYLERAVQASANYYFLQTEPVTDDEKPSKKRYDEIKNNIKKGSKTMELEASNFLTEFNQKYINELNFWNGSRTFAYIAAIALYILGVWVAFNTQDNKNEEVIREVKGLIPRVNALIKKLNRNT